MKPEIIQDYLQRAEMTEAQSTALSHIFGEMATRSDVLRLEDRMRHFEDRMDQKFTAFEIRMDERFSAFEERMDQRFSAYEERMNQRFSAYEERMDQRFGKYEERMNDRFGVYEVRMNDRMDRKLSDMQSEMTWRIVALVGLIVTIGTALNIFVG